jgi:predicted PurR-regulated permease PerM
MPGHTLSKLSNDRSEFPPLEKTALPIDSRAQLATRTAFAILLVLLALWVASDFLTALAWAAVIAITTWPVYIRFATLISDDRSPGLAPLLFTLLTGLVLIVPIILTVHQITQGSDAFMLWVTNLRQDGIRVPGWVAQLPIAGEYLDGWWQANLSNPRAVVEWLRGVNGVNMESVTAWTSALGGELLHRLFLFLITLMALFLVFREGAWLADRVLDTIDRLLGDPGERLASKIADAIRGTVNGIVAVALAEAAIIGIGFVLAGVPHPLLFAVVTMAFAMLPFGAWAAFTAAALVLLFHGGSLLAAAVVFGFGATVMLISDNFVQPALVGGRARLPFLLALIGIFGGLRTFGLIGLFLGPVIMTALLTVLREWVGIKD